MHENGPLAWHAGGMEAKRQPAGEARVQAETVARIERSMGVLGTAAIAAMDERLPWFRKMSAENRSWLGLVAQAGVAAFVDWIKHPERTRPAAGEVFGTAPRELARAVSLQRAVEMVRVIIDAVETQVESLAAPGPVSTTITCRSHALVTVNWKSTPSSGVPDKKTSSSAAQALCACW